MGAALGNYFDDGLEGIALDDSLGIGATERVQSAFFTTTFAVMGYVAKSDGKVTRDEIELAEQVMQQMHLTSEQRVLAINLFNEGKKESFPLNDVLAQFKREAFRRRNLVQMFLEILTSTALADGSLHGDEERTLQHISAQLTGGQRSSSSCCAWSQVKRNSVICGQSPKSWMQLMSC